MCGICGFSGGESIDAPIVIKRMAATIEHRGREAGGIFLEKSVALGHQRLSILDLNSRSDQPMVSTDQRFVIVFNGEIYNYRDLLKEISDFTPRTTSDTELLLELWIREGVACLEKLNGMFAFAIYDRQSGEIFCARDRLGVKPFYYWFNDGSFVFASEAKAILEHPQVHPRLNLPAVSDFLSLGYIPGQKTAFTGILKLEPGHCMTFSGAGLKKQCYWNLGQRISSGNLYRSDSITELLESAIDYRLISDVPVGSFLSGGIDSAAITAIAARKANDLQTFTIGFAEKAYDESVAASELAAHFQLSNITDFFHPPDIGQLEKVVDFFDQPFADSSTMPFFQLCENASRKIKTVLCGDGGDELFAGYETRRADSLALYGQRFVPFWRRLLRLCRKFVSLIPADRGKVSMHYKIRQFLDFAHLSPQQSHFSWRLLFTEPEKLRFFHPDINMELAGYQTWETIKVLFDSVADLPPLLQQAVVDIQCWMADDILYKADQASMAHTLEVRAPFLDYRIVESAFAIPEEKKFNLLQTKKILREEFKELLPNNVLKRKKEGFGSPVSLWLEGRLAEPFLDYVSSGFFKEVFPDTDYIVGLHRDHCNRVKDHGYRLWALFMFALWQKRWLKGL